jgi:plasmid stabilization system protein ParE
MTGHAYRFRPQARDDVVALARHIALDNLPVAERFLDAVEATCVLLAELPRSGAMRSFRHPALKGMRMMRVHGFEPHLIFYLGVFGPNRQESALGSEIESTRDWSMAGQ